jgi:hypothetical protein
MREELGDVEAVAPELVGVYTHQAAGQPEKQVRIELFRAGLTGEPRAHSEIGELVWFSAGDDWSALAPSLSKAIFPDLVARRLLGW